MKLYDGMKITMADGSPRTLRTRTGGEYWTVYDEQWRPVYQLATEDEIRETYMLPDDRTQKELAAAGAFSARDSLPLSEHDNDCGCRRCAMEMAEQLGILQATQKSAQQAASGLGPTYAPNVGVKSDFTVVATPAFLEMDPTHMQDTTPNVEFGIQAGDWLNGRYPMHQTMADLVSEGLDQARTLRNLPGDWANSLDSAQRKATPLFSGVMAYWPDALAALAQYSKAGNDKHNPGEHMHWAREKSKDHEDCTARHLLGVGRVDTDGHRHELGLAWRALCILQLAIEKNPEAFK